MLSVNGLVNNTFRRVGYVAPERTRMELRPKLTIAELARRTFPRWVQLPYQDMMDTYLMQVADYIATGGQSGIGRLMIFAPPRHGKSLKVSRVFPAWLMGHLPDTKLLLTGYNLKLPRGHSRWVRNAIDSDMYRTIFPSVRLAPDSSAADEWRIAGREGEGRAAGVGGGITGQGATLTIIDDPVKGRAEAESETMRERLHEWYGSDLISRVEEPGGAIVVMHTRWHVDDLAGWLLLNEKEDWTVLTFPALAEAGDQLGRAEGEALWPDRYTADWLAKRRARNEYEFYSLYQQAPRDRTGGLFDTAHIKVIDHAPECAQIVRFYDLAVTAKRKSDYTVGLKLGVTHDEQLVVLDIWRGQKELPDVQAAITQNAQIDGSKVRIRLEAEKAGIVGLQYLLRDPAMRPYTMDAVPPQGDKFTRAAPVASRVNAGRVSIVRAAWNRSFLDELAVFGPAAAHDDQVDALSGAYDMLSVPKARSEIW
jgi:predicted phage terminase large subunit-like protein